eukprot:g4624.t1
MAAFSAAHELLQQVEDAGAGPLLIEVIADAAKTLGRPSSASPSSEDGASASPPPPSKEAWLKAIAAGILASLPPAHPDPTVVAGGGETKLELLPAVGPTPAIVQQVVDELFSKTEPPAGGWSITTKVQATHFLLRNLAAASAPLRSTQRDGTLTDPDDVVGWQNEEIRTWAAIDLSEDVPDDVRDSLATGITSGLALLRLKRSDLTKLLGLGALSRDDVRQLLVECGAGCSKDDDDEDSVSTVEENCGLQADVLLDCVEDGFCEGADDDDRTECCDDYEITEAVGQAIYNRCIAIQAETEKRVATLFPKFVAPALQALDVRKKAFQKKKWAAEAQQRITEKRKLRALKGGRAGYFAQLDDDQQEEKKPEKKADERYTTDALSESKEAQDPAAAAASVNLVGEVMKEAADVVSAASSAASGSGNLTTTGARLVPRFMDGLATDNNELLTKVSNTFVERARAIGTVIIADHFKPVEQRVFKPKDMGGIAGGTKYIEDGILFKFANPDGEGSPYGESFELANKAAGLDLSGAIAIMHGAQTALGQDEQLHVSLQALVDHLGFRVQVMTLLPLGDGSLKVGSDDACTTLPHGGFDDTEKELNRRMAKVAASMGLAGHEIRVGDKTVELHFGADVECHLDKDDKARVLDTARVFPPENPLDKSLVVPPVPGHSSIYWRLLRPELIDAFVESPAGKPLSSDGFSQFAGQGKDFKEQNDRLKEATRFLMEEQVPLAASALLRERGDWWAAGGKVVTRILHANGVNMRHAGAVWTLLGEWKKICSGDNVNGRMQPKPEQKKYDAAEDTSTPTQPCAASSGESKSDGNSTTTKNKEDGKVDQGSSVPQEPSAARKPPSGAESDAIDTAQRAVAQEMAVRVVKNLVRADLRLGLSVGAGPVELRRIVVRSFSCITNGDKKSERYWAKIADGLKSRFGVTVPDVRKSTNPIELVKAVAERVGTNLTQACLHDLQGQNAPTSVKFVFTEADIESQEPRIKFLDVDDRAQGALLLNAANHQEEADVDTKRRLLAQCDSKLSAALATFAGDLAGSALPARAEEAVDGVLSQAQKIAVIKVEQVECICKSRGARRASLRRRKEEVWPAVERVGAFAAVAGLYWEDGGDDSSVVDALVLDLAERLYRALKGVKMANLAWNEGVVKFLEPAAKQLDDKSSSDVTVAATASEGDDDGESKVDSMKASAQSSSGAKGLEPAEAERAASRKPSRRLALMERMLAVDGVYYPLRQAACDAFCARYGGGRNGGGRAAELPVDASDAMMELLAEAKWGAFRVGDEVEARLGVKPSEGWGPATITECKAGGIYALDYEDKSVRGGTGWVARLEFWCVRDGDGDDKSIKQESFRGRVAGEWAKHEKLAAGATTSDDCKQELLAWVWDFGRSANDTGDSDSSRARSDDWGVRLGSAVTTTMDAADKQALAVEASFAKREDGHLGAGAAVAFRNAIKLNVVDDEMGRTMLMRAVVRKDVALVSHLVACGVDVDICDKKGQSAVWLACEQGNADIARLLLEGGAELNEVDSDKCATPLFIAAEGGHGEIAKLLIGAGAKVDQATTDVGRTPLYVAAYEGHGEIVTLLIGAGANVDKAKTDIGSTPLFVAAQQGRGEIVTLLIGAGANVDPATTASGMTPLCAAAQEGHGEIVALLIGAGANIDQARTDTGRTPLYIAAQKGNGEIVMLLIGAGAKVDQATTDDGSTPLFIAAQKGKGEIVTLLIGAGANVDKARTDIGATPLYIAADRGHGEIVTLLIGAGANIVTLLIGAGAKVDQATTDDGSTPLFIAAQKGKGEIVTLLIGAGANVDKARTDIGATPLYIAADRGHGEIVTLLIGAGAKVDQATTDDGSTPLFIAAQKGKGEIVTLLIGAGANVDKARTDIGATPLYIAAD